MIRFRLRYHAESPGLSPWRIFDGASEIAWINDFLDAQHIRNLSPRSIRAYAYDLLNFARWWCGAKRWSIPELRESHLLDYVRHQLESTPQPTPQTINHRLTVVRSLYRFHYGREIPRMGVAVQAIHKTRNPLGYGRSGCRVVGLRLKQPRRVVVPLSCDEVSRFWSSLRTYRDLSIVALMLFNGLRSHEILGLRLEQLRLAEATVRVQGKGNKQRVLPLWHDTIQTLRLYLDHERPVALSPHVFLSLKGPRRGNPMSAAGLRSVFRHHRKITNTPLANAHRFRHTFGADMVRSGVSLPALMHLMGHSHIQTTMLYVRLSPQDVWEEYRRAVQNRTKLTSSPI